MVLDIGKGGLFRNEGLQQDTGLLKDRWGQDGSTLINVSFSLAADGTARTVTAGKRFFVNSVILGLTANGTVAILDGGAGGTSKLFVNATAVETMAPPLSSPLYFDTDVYVNITGTTGTGTMTGWEEDLP